MRVADPARREHILEAAAHLFNQRHYHEVRMDDVAQAAGVAKGTVYRYFHDKEDLYQGLILCALERLYAEVQSELAGTEDAEEKLEMYVRASIDFFVRHPYFFDLVQRIETCGNASHMAKLHAARQRFFDLIAELIQHLVKTGKYVTTRPELAALSLSGTIRQILRFHPRPFPADLDRWIVRQFLNGIGRSETANGHVRKKRLV